MCRQYMAGLPLSVTIGNRCKATEKINIEMRLEEQGVSEMICTTADNAIKKKPRKTLNYHKDTLQVSDRKFNESTSMTIGSKLLFRI